jgi:TRAP-type mannitol/chloroaromatic compound transport system permease small subunit
MQRVEPTAFIAAVSASADLIDKLVAAIGRAAMWLALFLVLMQFAVVVARYAFGIGSIWLSESIIYAHAAMFLLSAAWMLQLNGHVRVDVLYAGFSSKQKAAVDLVGSVLLLLPVMTVIMYFAVHYVGRSWSILERSREASGLPFVYLLKTLIPLFALLMGLQGIAQALRACLLLAMLPLRGAAARNS